MQAPENYVLFPAKVTFLDSLRVLFLCKKKNYS